jgi:hypothetical protein
MSAQRRQRAMPPGGDDRPRSSRRRDSSDGDRATRWIAVGGVVLATVALVLVVWGAIGRGSDSCQTAAWDTTPGAGDLPSGWTIGASQYDPDRKFMRFLGPVSADGSSQPTIDATVTCFAEGAADSVTRSRDAVAATGETVTSRDDLGDQAFIAVDQSGATLLQMRNGNLVVYLVGASGTQGEVETVASAFDLAMGGDGGQAPVGTLDVSIPPVSESAGPSSSDEALASESPVAPELEALIPTSIGGIDLSISSQTGDAILADDPNSRAIVAALRAAGKDPVDLRVADGYGYDDTSGTEFEITAFSVDGMKVSALKALVLSSWLSASGAGITTDTAKVGGVDVTRVDRGDGGAVDYVLTRGGDVIVVTTSDEGLASQALAALPSP